MENERGCVDTIEEIDTRIRAICCRQWGVPPWELAAAVEAGRVTWPQVQAALTLEAVSHPLLGDWLEIYLTPRATVAKRERSEEERLRAGRIANMRRLAAMATARTDEERAALERLREALAGGGAGAGGSRSNG